MAATRRTSPRTKRQVGKVRSARKAAKDTTREVARQVESTAGAARQLVAEGVRDEITKRVLAGADQVGVFARALRTAGDQLADDGQERPADFVRQAAERLEDLGSYLEGEDPEAILADLQDLARRNPWLLGVAGAFLGLATSRFVKASSR